MHENRARKRRCKKEKALELQKRKEDREAKKRKQETSKQGKSKQKKGYPQSTKRKGKQKAEISESETVDTNKCPIYDMKWEDDGKMGNG